MSPGTAIEFWSGCAVSAVADGRLAVLSNNDVLACTECARTVASMAGRRCSCFGHRSHSVALVGRLVSWPG